MKYRYSGPTSGVTLQKGADDSAQEVMLHTGSGSPASTRQRRRRDSGGESTRARTRSAARRTVRE